MLKKLPHKKIKINFPYIPYEKIGNILANFVPFTIFKNKINSFFYELKITQNRSYSLKNEKEVINKIKNKIKLNKKVEVAFLCNEKEKWKCQSVFNLMLNDNLFHPYILATKNAFNSSRFDSQTIEDVKKTHDFFKNHLKLETYYAYDIKNDCHIPIEKFNPDIVFYEQPWGNETSQGPVVSSKYALTCYVPYFISNVATKMEYGLRFHQYVQNHFILNDLIKNYYSKNMRNKGKNLIVTGHPQLDYFLFNDKNLEKKYVIYAPHWSINYPQENYATFVWNGKFILDFAKKHTEINWIFKPHPTLKFRLISENIMTIKEVENYYNEWGKIGIKYENGDYLDLFNQSWAMITDCGSFLTEYFLTEQPVIHLLSKNSAGYNPYAQSIVENYYKASNLSELEELLNEIIINKKDSLKEKRLKSLKELNFKENYAAKNIINYLKNKIC